MIPVSPSVSGCHVVALDTTAVYKYTKDTMYFNRLEDQARKQEDMRERFMLFGIQVPRVTSHFRINGKEAGFQMEYLPYTGYIDYIEKTGYSQAKTTFRKLLDYISDGLNTTFYNSYPSMDLVEKEMKKASFPEEYTYVGEMIRSQAVVNPLPISRCHGDLTFSNLMFGNGNLAVIDFNDVPLESIILDIIKLRQDSKHHWTSFMTSRSHDALKMKVFDDWFNCQLETILIHRGIDMRYYAYWEALNYLRIFRNAGGQQHIYNYLVGKVKEILS